MRVSARKVMLLSGAIILYSAFPSGGTPLEESSQFPVSQSEKQQLAAKLLFSGQLQRAEALLSQLCGMPEARLEPRAEAECLHMLGLASILQDRPEGALGYLQRSLKILLHLENSFCTAQVSLMIGGVETKLGNFPRGLGRLEEALSIFHDLFKHAAELSPEDLATGCFPSAPKSGNLENHLSTKIGREAVLMIQIIITHLTLAALWLEDGTLHEAERHLEIARPLAELFGDLLLAPTEMITGEMRYRQGRLDEARSIFEQLVAAAPSSQNPMFSIANAFQISSAFDRLSEIAVQQGQLDQALFWNSQERERAKLAGDIDGEVDSLGSKAMLFVSQLKITEAQESLREAEELARTKGSPLAQARVAMMRAMTLTVQGRTLDALRNLERAVGLYGGLKRPSEEAMAWGLLYLLYSLSDAGAAVGQEAKIAAKRENTHKAAQALIRLAQEAVDRSSPGSRNELDWLRHAPGGWQQQITQYIGFVEQTRKERASESDLLEVESQTAAAQVTSMPIFRAHFLYLEGLLLLSRDEFRAAKARFESALSDMRKTEHEEFEGRLLTHRAICLWKLDHKKEAIEDLKAAVRAYEAASLRIDVLQLQKRIFAEEKVQSAYEVLTRTLLSMSNEKEAFEVNDGSLSRALMTSLVRGSIAAQTSMDVRLQQERIQSLESDSVKTNERNSLLSEERTRYEGVLLRSQVIASSVVIAPALTPISLKSFQENLPEDTAVVEYRLFDDNQRGAAWLIDRQSIEYFPLEINPAIMIMALKWSTLLSQPGRGAERLEATMNARDRATPTLVRKMLFEPFQARIAKSKVVVIPHGWLHHIPFGALEDHEGPLVQKFSFSYAPSAGVLDFLWRKETPLGGRALVVGDPDNAGHLHRLPHAASEAKSVAELLGTQAIVGADATEHRFFQESPEADIIHIAAHSVDFPEHPLFSRLLLAPGAAGEDGKVEMHEVLQGLELKEANLVVLAACRTALGEVDRGQEVSSLSRAFLMKGASGVLSSLWEIDDRATSILMAEFYKHLVAGLSAAEALQAAQLALRGTPEFNDPAYWAAFVLLGSPRGSWRVQ